MPPLPPSRPGAGRRRALLIGIDYVNAHPDVPGAGVGVWATLEAQDDARNFGRFLIGVPCAAVTLSAGAHARVGAEHRGWNSKDITYMLDSDECALELWPTKENIVRPALASSGARLTPGAAPADNAACAKCTRWRPLHLLLCVRLRIACRLCSCADCLQTQAIPTSWRAIRGAK
jgi:hypothetical protein